MTSKKVFILGNDDMVIMFGLLGIDGKVVNKNEDLLPIFEDLISDISIGMIIVTLDLTEDQISYLLNFKLNHKRPLIYILPDILDLEGKDEVFLENYEDILEPLAKR